MDGSCTGEFSSIWLRAASTGKRTARLTRSFIFASLFQESHQGPPPTSAAADSDVASTNASDSLMPVRSSFQSRSLNLPVNPTSQWHRSYSCGLGSKNWSAQWRPFLPFLQYTRNFQFAGRSLLRGQERTRRRQQITQVIVGTQYSQNHTNMLDGMLMHAV